jgi:hypothetical protein
MINLIPPSAKKSIIAEYWSRVISVWFAVWFAAILAGISVLVPAYVLIASQVKVYTDSATAASEEIVDFENVTKELTRSSQQAKLLLDGFSEPLMSDYVALFTKLEGDDVTVTKMNIIRSGKIVGPVQISGEATTRQALADFRDRLRAQPEVTAVDLPISNLAKDKDIQFTLSISLNNPTSP